MVIGMQTRERNSSLLEGMLRPDQDPSRPIWINWEAYRTQVGMDWRSLLDNDPPEQDVQEFLELHPSMIPGGSGDVGPGGHHRSEMRAVFRCPTISGAGRSFSPDFMWVTHSSALITPILIEIEKPSKRWFTLDGRPTANFTQAHDQLNDWRSWFRYEENQALFRRKFLFHDRYQYRVLQPYFLLVYGRRSEFDARSVHENPGELLHKRDTMRISDESFMTFDSLSPRYDHRDALTVTMTATGPTVFAVSPHYGTTTDTGRDAVLLGSISDALHRSVNMSSARKQYLEARWNHWRQVELDQRASGTPTPLRTSGLE